MMKYHGPKDRLDAAQSSATPPEELALLSRSDYIFVREAVATNDKTPEEVLESLVPHSLESDDEFKIALALVKNSALSPRLVAAIAQLVCQVADRIGPRDYYSTQLVDALVRNVNVPEYSLLPLTKADTIPRFIRGRIAAVGVRPELLRRLLTDPSEKIRSRARRALGEEAEANPYQAPVRQGQNNPANEKD
jgi:hypothetical protein